MMFSKQIKILAASPILALASAYAVLAQSIDPTAPLDILKKAQDKAKTSSLKTDTIQSTMSGWAELAVLAGGLFGLFLALYSAYELYTSQGQERGQQGSWGGAMLRLIIGSLMTVFAVIVGFITTSVFN